ncbi:MAG: YadA-like family protein, partial [Blastomonas fulva]
VNALTGQVNTLFDLTEVNRRAINRANEGVAMALAMESPALPPGTTFALSGGVGYYEDQASLTTAITARVAENASVSAGIGVGFNSGSVGARGGFQIAW